MSIMKNFSVFFEKKFFKKDVFIFKLWLIIEGFCVLADGAIIC